jgi:hypothetical protein
MQLWEPVQPVILTFETLGASGNSGAATHCVCINYFSTNISDFT